MNAGVPRGTKLGPILFLVIVNDLNTLQSDSWKYVDDLTISEIMAIEIPGGKRNLKININAQQTILNAYITNNSSLFKIYSANVSLLHRNIIRAI